MGTGTSLTCSTCWWVTRSSKDRMRQALLASHGEVLFHMFSNVFPVFVPVVFHAFSKFFQLFSVSFPVVLLSFVQFVSTSTAKPTRFAGTKFQTNPTNQSVSHFFLQEASLWGFIFLIFSHLFLLPTLKDHRNWGLSFHQAAKHPAPLIPTLKKPRGSREWKTPVTGIGRFLLFTNALEKVYGRGSKPKVPFWGPKDPSKVVYFKGSNGMFTGVPGFDPKPYTFSKVCGPAFNIHWAKRFLEKPQISWRCGLSGIPRLRFYSSRSVISPASGFKVAPFRFLLVSLDDSQGERRWSKQRKPWDTPVL